MELSKVLLLNYLPYSKSVIIERAIPGIDGLKPVQRRALYTMKKLGLQDGDKTKCQKINGATMSIHPHGDSSIYESLVLMSTGYEGLNVPLVESKGSFGKKYSRDLKYAAPRYTEAKLAPVCKELFDGIDEDAVNFVDNFDGTEQEPELLPIKFPSILVNSSAGIAVGYSTNIPTFSLSNVCKATQGVLSGKIVEPEDLANVLGAPEFPTGGYLHSNNAKLVDLCATGHGRFKIGSHMMMGKGIIIVDEIPYTTTAEDIIDSVVEHMKDGQLRGVKSIRDEIGLQGLRLVIELKSGCDPKEVLKSLLRLTPLQSSIAFRTRVIIDDTLKTLSVKELIDEWIKFRQTTVTRTYACRKSKALERVSKLTLWEKIIGSNQASQFIENERAKRLVKNLYIDKYTKEENDELIKKVKDVLKSLDAPNKIKEAAGLVTRSDEDLVTNAVKQAYNLSDTEAEYLLGMQLRTINIDRVARELIDLIDNNNKIKCADDVMNADHKYCNELIYNELQYIIDKYGQDNKTALADEITEEELESSSVQISDESVLVVLTKDGYIKKVSNMNDISKYTTDSDMMTWSAKNNEYMLIFDRFGKVHKLLIDDIEGGRGNFKDSLYQKIHLEKQSDIIWVDAAGDYSGYFYLVYPNGGGTRVFYNKAAGTRSKYNADYNEVTPGRYWITTEDEFFIVTDRKKAAFINLANLGIFNTRRAFKVARISGSEHIVCIRNKKDIINQGFIDFARYSNQYTVRVGDDVMILPESMRDKFDVGQLSSVKSNNVVGNGVKDGEDVSQTVQNSSE